MRLSRILRTAEPQGLKESIPVGRMLIWAAVWIGLISGIFLYFRYARLLTPLLG